VSYPTTLTSQAQGDVLRERERQFYGEGWTDTHDDSHVNGELAGAASAYAMVAAAQAMTGSDDAIPAEPPPFFLFDRAWWKPKDQRSNLVRAAALIIAEIERLDRAAAKAGEAQA
jgi:hypothetical protein